MSRSSSKKPDTDLAKYVPTLAQLGGVLGVSSRWIAELRSRGAMPANGATLAESVQAWGAHMSATAAVDGEAGDLDAARTRLTMAQAEAVERRNAVERGELAPLADMRDTGAGVIAHIVAQLQHVGARVAQGDVKLRQRIEAEVNHVLTDLSMTRVEEEVAHPFVADAEEADG